MTNMTNNEAFTVALADDTTMGEFDSRVAATAAARRISRELATLTYVYDSRGNVLKTFRPSESEAL